MTVHMKGVIYTCNMAAAPLPFRKHCDTWRVWGFENQPVRFTLPPIARLCHEAFLDRIKFKAYIHRRLVLESGDRMRVAALRRVLEGLEIPV